jgi:stage II sporulation protein R
MSKNIIFSAVMVLIAVLFIAVMPTEAEGAVYEDTVRLHILAESDSAEDQAVKIALRDAVLFEFGARLLAKESADGARQELALSVDEIEDFCRAEIARLGYSGTVSVTLIKEWYETREYADFTLPAGVYTSLKIVIGKGEGQNWWCVMYPPMCLDVAIADEAADRYTDEERALISGNGYRAKFKILELISSAFS